MRVPVVLFIVMASSAFPQARAQATKKVEIEAGANYRALTNNYPPWRGLYLRSILQPESRDTVYLEALRQSEFGDTGTYMSAGDTHVFNQEWYVFLAAAGSSGGFFFPRVRVDGQLNKKWLARRQLVTSVGGGYFMAKDPHRDANINLGAIYYFRSPWIVQGGIRWNRSAPGAIVSQSQFLALTQGQDGRHYLVFRGETGRQAYQAIGPAAVLVDFPVQVFSAGWKEWLGEDWGFNAVTEYYTSQVYRRTGVSVGIFKSF